MSDEHTTRTDYPNGSYEVRHKLVQSVGYIVARNPFGGTWRMNIKGDKIHGAEGIPTLKGFIGVVENGIPILNTE